MKNPKREMLRQLLAAANYAVDKHLLRQLLRVDVVIGYPPEEFFHLKSGIERWWHNMLTFVASLREASHMAPHDRAQHAVWQLNESGVAFARRLLSLDDRALPWRGPGGEQPWHRSMVSRLHDQPQHFLTDLECDPVVNSWCNSVFTGPGRRGTRLWGDRRRPDVVFELASGRWLCIEVEPMTSIAQGILQVADYGDRLRKEGLAAGQRRQVRAILVVPSATLARSLWQDLADLHHVEIVSAPENIR